jgi:hypothetical protein
MTPEERVRLEQIITREINLLAPFLNDIDQNSKANGGKRGTAYSRLDTWINRYRDVVNQAKVSACADMKMRWTLGPTEHCKSCFRLSGKVKRGSYWNDHVLPQNPPNGLLECGGWKCQCTLRPTDDRASSGPLPRLP